MTAPSLAPLAILDRAHLAAMTADDTDLAIEVIEIFQHQTEIWSRLLDPKADASQWSDAAHTIKGASLGIGAFKLAAACERAERAGRSDTPPSVTGAAVLLGEIRDCTGETLEAAAKAIHDLQSSGARRAS